MNKPAEIDKAPPTSRVGRKQDRDKRLAEKLRTNLAKRKSQARDRQSDDTA
ncbi:MAG: hypothetical protein HOB37_14945 [Rhodospirillaceae bacterium]|jgi:hypothetical protein|nr:hypothetical protein [Rhodospirillaceae bacterium]MBT3908125.1 hypothetical protein [Rhodospirillaceae bacterium]MBT5298278.1 hypothetical protein [Rhodospirillaceae bacterium]MBT5514882.1 hypothetical protein [Rhodospirillaceae bacterium]MBT6087325.1 hypothetical protein [Rhodospirillaceae bacterium]